VRYGQTPQKEVPPPIAGLIEEAAVQDLAGKEGLYSKAEWPLRPLGIPTMRAEP